MEDAQQEAVFALLQAIADYDRTQIVKVDGCRFRTFLGQVLRRWFYNFVKHLQRIEKHYERSLHAAAASEPGSTKVACVKEAVAQLDDASRQICEGLASGRPLRSIALELGISYAQAKRHKQKVLAELATQLAQ